MAHEAAAVFWSYAHEDNRLDGGNILALAEKLSFEYSLISGDELQLFSDRDIKWGEEWERRIDNALMQTTFFIAVVTPRYFESSECRREATALYGKATALGVGDLLLPILYAPIPNFSKDNQDELIALLSSYQYTDWRGLRLESPDSAEYRRGVHAIAERLLQVESTVKARQLDWEVSAVGESPLDEAGIVELIEAINRVLPEWTEAVEASTTIAAQLNATASVYMERIRKQSNPGQSGARFAVLQRFSKEVIPLAERSLSATRTYSRTSIELDPLITRVFMLVENHPELHFALGDLYGALEEAESNISEDERQERAFSGVPFFAWLDSNAHLSRMVTQFSRIMKTDFDLIDETNAIVRRWLAGRDRLMQIIESSRVGDDTETQPGDDS
jgi:TIR domain